jgi:hypothetical protein
LPIKAYQIWSEPNIASHYFQTAHPVRDYAKLLKISHSAIRSVQSHAKIVIAGMPPYARPRSWKFLDRLYHTKGFKRHFEVGAPHPYAWTFTMIRRGINKYRRVMNRHHDRHTPLWFTEFGWGSAKPDGFINVGLTGQARRLRKSFRLFQHNRRRWHLQRVIWFDWRDPSPPTEQCSFCNTAGLLRPDFSRKPAYFAFKGFVRHH